MSLANSALDEGQVMRSTITALLGLWGRRDSVEEARLFEEIYPKLLEIAARLLRKERHNHTLDPPALVHETFLRLLDQRRNPWRNRGHFFAVAATTMRRVLNDYARRRGADKRAAVTQAVPLREEILADTLPDAEVGKLHDLLSVLLAKDAHLAAVVELRFFGGLTLDEVATVLKRSRTSIVADWKRARLWLLSQLSTAG